MRSLRGLLPFLVAGCLPEPAAPEPLAPTGNDWSDCYRTFQPTEDPAADVATLAAACAAPAGMRAVTPVHTGDPQATDDRPTRFVFRARGGRCYRAFAVGAPGVDDLDVAIHDAAGRLVTGDVSRDRWPIVPPRGPACTADDATLTVEVAVTRGHGPWVLQVWGTERE